jgi:hypothetical protein
LFGLLKYFNKNKGSDPLAEKPGNLIIEPEIDELWKTIQKRYPLKKYVIKEDIGEQLGPHSEIIHNSLKKNDEYPKVLYSYITFHQIYFHMKNYILRLKKRDFGYRHEFLDIFQDIFIDNFVIFKELATVLNNKYVHYLNIWLDGFFLSLFNKIEEDSIKKYHRIQPHLFFLVILFLSLPKVSKEFKEIPFTDILKFSDSTEEDWNASINIIKDIEFDHPISSGSIEKISDFIERFFHINVQTAKNGRLSFDEEGILKAVDLLNLLKARSEEMIKNIISKRKSIIKN